MVGSPEALLVLWLVTMTPEAFVGGPIALVEDGGPDLD